jgi:NTF2-like N-terminal transpeptidase domain
MSRMVAIAFGVLTIVLVAVGTLFPAKTDVSVMYISGEGTGATQSDKTPQDAVLSVFDNVRSRNYHEAYAYIGNTNQVDEQEFLNDMRGTYGSLRTYSNLESTDVKVLNANDNSATVRATTKWATAVGPYYETKDLKVENKGGLWKVDWPHDTEAKTPPQVIPVNYLRWDVVWRGAGDDWGSQNVEAPHVRLVSMKALQHGTATVVVGEILNEDTVPAHVSVNATLVGKDGNPVGQESSFDKINHVLLPKEVSPFRIDFPNVRLDQVKSVRMQPDSSLVPASADPVIGVLNQKAIVDARGRHVLQGELENQSGMVVNIPHVLVTCYNNIGQVIWVSDGYVDKALLPQTPEAFSVDIPDDIAGQVQSYRVVVNQYSNNRT